MLRAGTFKGVKREVIGLWMGEDQVSNRFGIPRYLYLDVDGGLHKTYDPKIWTVVSSLRDSE